MNVPPCRRANRKLNSAVRAVPMCSGPVGLGAIRQRMVMPASVPEGDRLVPRVTDVAVREIGDASSE